LTVEKHGVEADVSFGISNVVPDCPNGHGEMEIADDQLPVEAAFEQVAEQLNGAKPTRLPFPNAFNDSNALEHVIAVNHEFQDDEKVYLAAKDKAKDAKERMDATAKRLKEVIAKYEQLREDRQREIERRQAAIDRGEDPDAEIIVCRFSLLHPGVPCPFDHAGLSADHLTSEAHAVEAHDLLVKLEIEICVVELAAIGVIVTAELLGALPIDQLSEVQAWSKDAQDPERRAELLAGLPRGLGRPHVAPNGHTSEATDTGKGHGSGPADNYQSCDVCGARILTLDDGIEPYPSGALVGTDCVGKNVEHHYPKGKKKKRP
jgi:hypothetical protein